jgi:uncharacterized RDD family membrane protein YckC
VSDSPDNGYPPSAPAPQGGGNNIASRPKRFFAAMIDGAAGMALSSPVYQHYGVWEAMMKGTELPGQVVIGLTLYSLALFFVLHGFLLWRYGQTLGKRLTGLAIVTLDGQKPAFAPLILNRYLPQWVVGVIPGFGVLLALADITYLFFNEQNRCVHDLLAKTKVIDLSIKVTTTAPAATGNSMLA